ncbi:MAG TPA: serine hydrolase [Candidatus Cybelea sp.]|jgi:CubicO group peptidase (beta-lactamase class C family)|nr:serine hydrolase [Candidatus Cybelea sp.]
MMRDIDTAAAIEYAAAHDLRAILISRGGEVVARAFGEGATEQSPSALYSGTKSFWGPVALCAQADGVLDLDEPVFATLDEWRDDPWKRRVTARMLLSLTAGFGFGGLGAAVPVYERALAMPLKNEPGTRFTYGGIPFQAFGALLARRLASTTPRDYLHERVLRPAGVRIESWRRLADGTQPLPTGATLSARDWLAYGHYVLRERERFAQCFIGSPANARYGLGWWLGAKDAPGDLIYASGSGGQALYVVPSLELAIVRFGRRSSYRHETFLKRLFRPR